MGDINTLAAVCVCCAGAPQNAAGAVQRSVVARALFFSFVFSSSARSTASRRARRSDDISRAMVQTTGLTKGHDVWCDRATLSLCALRIPL
jgi:hypothetical protein